MRIWRVKPPALSDEADFDGDDGDGSEGKWAGSIVGEFDDHKYASLVTEPMICILIVFFAGPA